MTSCGVTRCACFLPSGACCVLRVASCAAAQLSRRAPRLVCSPRGCCCSYGMYTVAIRYYMPDEESVDMSKFFGARRRPARSSSHARPRTPVCRCRARLPGRTLALPGLRVCRLPGNLQRPAAVSPCSVFALRRVREPVAPHRLHFRPDNHQGPHGQRPVGLPVGQSHHPHEPHHRYRWCVQLLRGPGRRRRTARRPCVSAP